MNRNYKKSKRVTIKSINKTREKRMKTSKKRNKKATNIGLIMLDAADVFDGLDDLTDIQIEERLNIMMYDHARQQNTASKIASKKKAMSETDIDYVIDLAEDRARYDEVEIDVALRDIVEEYAKGMRNHIRAEPDEIYSEVMNVLQREYNRKAMDVNLEWDIDWLWENTPVGISLDRDSGSVIVRGRDSSWISKVEKLLLYFGFKTEMELVNDETRELLYVYRYSGDLEDIEDLLDDDLIDMGLGELNIISNRKGLSIPFLNKPQESYQGEIQVGDILKTISKNPMPVMVTSVSGDDISTQDLETLVSEATALDHVYERSQLAPLDENDKAQWADMINVLEGDYRLVANEKKFGKQVWVEPDGTVHDVFKSGTHALWARDNYEIAYSDDANKFLMDKGWIRIGDMKSNLGTQVYVESSRFDHNSLDMIRDFIMDEKLSADGEAYWEVAGRGYISTTIEDMLTSKGSDFKIIRDANGKKAKDTDTRDALVARLKSEGRSNATSGKTHWNRVYFDWISHGVNDITLELPNGKVKTFDFGFAGRVPGDWVEEAADWVIANMPQSKVKSRKAQNRIARGRPSFTEKGGEVYNKLKAWAKKNGWEAQTENLREAIGHDQFYWLKYVEDINPVQFDQDWWDNWLTDRRREQLMNKFQVASYDEYMEKQKQIAEESKNEVRRSMDNIISDIQHEFNELKIEGNEFDGDGYTQFSISLPITNKSIRWYKKADELPGGLADDIPDEDFDLEQLAKGIQVELEHTDNLDLAKEIAKDHLMESDTYYDHLEEMEEEIESEASQKKLEYGNVMDYLKDIQRGQDVFLEAEGVPGRIDSIDQDKGIMYIDKFDGTISDYEMKDVADGLISIGKKKKVKKDKPVYKIQDYKAKKKKTGESDIESTYELALSLADKLEHDMKNELLGDMIRTRAEIAYEKSSIQSLQWVIETAQSYIEEETINIGEYFSKKKGWVDTFLKDVDVPSHVVQEKSRLEREVVRLSDRFMELGDLLKEAVDISKEVKDIISTIAGARSGILYELNKVMADYENLKRSYSKHKVADVGLEELGRNIQELTREWNSLDGQISQKERELNSLESDRDRVVYDMKNLGDEMQKAEKEFDLDNSGLSFLPSRGWFAKILKSGNANGMHRIYQETLEDFKMWMEEIPEDQLNQMISEKALELEILISDIKLAEAKLNDLKKQKKEKIGFFDKLSTALGKELLETESHLIKIKKWSQKKPLKWKAVALWVMEKLDEDLRKEADDFVTSLEVMDERVRVTPMMKSESENGTGFYVYQYVTDKDKLGWNRKKIWSKACKHYSNEIDIEHIQDVFEKYYTNKKAEGAWDKLKGYVQKVWDSGIGLINKMKTWNNELENLVFEEVYDD